MSKTPEQRILELAQKVKLFEKQKAIESSSAQVEQNI